MYLVIHDDDDDDDDDDGDDNDDDDNVMTYVVHDRYNIVNMVFGHSNRVTSCMATTPTDTHTHVL